MRPIEKVFAIVAVNSVLLSGAVILFMALVVRNRKPGVDLYAPYRACFLFSPEKLTDMGLFYRRWAMATIIAILALLFVLVVALYLSPVN
jgi:hypothetical protein